MTILNVFQYLSPTGESGQSPNILAVRCNNSSSEVVTAGFLTSSTIQPYSVSANDLVLVSYTNGVNLFNVAVSSAGVITLSPNTIIDGSIVNADVSASAAIAFSKLAALPSAQILVGNASNVPVAVATTGDVTIDNSGVTAITANAVVLGDLSTGIAPSHVVKFASRITWSGSGASLTTAVTGVAATDQVVATIQSAPTQAAYLVSAATNTNQVILTLSAANTSNDAVITYTVLRAAS